MTGLLCNEKKVIDILGRRTQRQRDSIAESYKALFGESLHKHLKSCMSDKLGKCMLLWMMDPCERDAVLLHEALSEEGSKKDRAAIGMLCPRTPGQLFLIKQAYYSVFSQTLENHLDGSGFVFLEPQNKVSLSVPALKFISLDLEFLFMICQKMKFVLLLLKLV